MPIYKISKHRGLEDNEHWSQNRVRLIGLIVSGVLLLATVALLLSQVAHRIV